MLNFLTKSGRRAGLSVLAAPFLLATASCTDLTVQPHDSLTPDNAFKSDAEILAGVAGIYATLRVLDNNVGYMSIEEVTTDMTIVPTRGSDWFDNGQWLEMHRQTWTPSSAGASTFLNSSWNDMFGAIAKENLMIDVVTKANSGAKGDSTLAELRTLRAFHYYLLMNMFGGVPLVTQYPTPGPSARVTRDSVFKFIEAELLAARDKLPLKWPAAYYGRLTKGAANALLATIYLNAGVFKKDVGPAAVTGKINPTSYNSCNGIAVTGGDACAMAIAAANAVITSNQYTLSANWADNFSLTNKNSTENIFVIEHSKDKEIGGNWPMRTLHYNQLNTGWGSPWNGFATTAETFAQFSATDDRRSMWLFGQAKSFQTGANVNDRAGAPLIFTPTIANAASANEAEGVRFNKFPPLADAPSGNGHPNDFTVFRLAEMYLIKAEAENEAGQTANALTDLKFIHDKHDAANAITAATQAQIRDAILKERLLEFAAEGKRRTDLIRHGKFTTWTEASANGVSNTARSPHLIVFPIPAPQFASNNKLVQNAGY
ncbi:MAG TPA: RagB/SusD family nutrient uptake outer membrane protein [Gemmatimonadaceae bacterium]|nr:RagB/SusD family nutrient uptake outer membrane protein [Gemmatimonadaceae bacterium]